MKRSPPFLGTMGGRFVVSGVLVFAVLGGMFAAWNVLRLGDPVRSETIQDGLVHPWDIAFAPDGRMLVTERAGRVLVFADATSGAPLLSAMSVPDVRAELESGLMGIAIHDDTVYVCASRDPGGDGGDPWRIDVLTATLAADGALSAFTALPIGPTLGGPRHQGCAVEIGPDDHLWVTIGDANLSGEENPAQDPDVPNGKVLRFELDGSVPVDAPFSSGAVSIGHRNPQGIAFREDGLILEVEHGTDVNDEINHIVPGANYGYPCVTGDGVPGPIPGACAANAVLSPPAWASGNPTIATSGATFLAGRSWGEWEGDLVVTTLKDEDLRRFVVGADGSVTIAETLVDGQFGRLRAAVIGPDGALYLSSANGDDRIVRIVKNP
jgi:glucose/arabinose dehydrogenase